MRHLPLALLVVAALSGCEAPTARIAPTVPSGVFVLQSVGAQPLPAIVYESATLRQSIIADTLSVELDGRGVRRLTLRSEFLVNDREPEVFSQSINLTIGAVDGRLTATEDVVCVADAAVDCGSQRVSTAGAQLSVGERRYVRVFDEVIFD